ncbi:hypothetical protein [Prosthecomicrobium sp. N25]|uniref:hypothetical protein n=1 Tax=Prosthecomicrobium sp. N25 TaxID=3129254 RepID=UPI003FCC9893
MIGLAPGGSVQFVSNDKGEVRLIAKRKDIGHLFGIFGPQDCSGLCARAVATTGKNLRTSLQACSPPRISSSNAPISWHVHSSPFSRAARALPTA